jgi:hypothetical protein
VLSISETWKNKGRTRCMTERLKDDSKIACNLIKRSRRYSRNIVKKSISTPFKIDGINLRNKIIINHNPFTGAISLSCNGIGNRYVTVYPTRHQKLNCTNEHALDMLKKQRDKTKKWREFRKYKLKNLAER